MSVYLGVAGKARPVKQMYLGVGGKARRVTKAYIGVGGKARLFYTSLTQLIKDIPTTVGQTCTWAGHNWTIVHITTDLIYMISTNIVSLTTFGTSAMYSQSNLVTLCDQFLSNIDAQYKMAMADVTVNGVTSKVFIPAHGMVCNNSQNPYSGTNGTNNHQASSGSYGDGTTAYPIFSWFNSARSTAYSNRIGRYNGSTQYWWLSTPCSSGKVWGVSDEGVASMTLSATSSTAKNGFRPCIAVKRK